MIATRLRWLAVAAAVVDYGENISNSVLLAFYPDRFPVLSSMSGPLTLIKFLLFGLCVLVAMSMFAIAFMRRRKAKPP